MFDKFDNQCCLNSRKGSITTLQGVRKGSSLSNVIKISNIITICLLEPMSVLYRVFVEQPSAFAAWRWTSSLVLWTLSLFEWIHHRGLGRSTGCRSDMGMFDAYQMHRKKQFFPTGITHCADGAPRSFSSRDGCHEVQED